MKDFQGKGAFITGGTSGIGLSIAKVFAAAGMKVAISYRREQQRDVALAELRAAGHAVHAIKLDVSDRTQMARAAAEAEQALGKVHVLVNNAGVSVFGPTDEATYDDYDWIMGVNFGGVVNGLVEFIPKLKAHGEGGHIVNVASMAAFLPGPQAGIYTASKFAIRGLTECLRDNLMPHNIGVSLMAPALVKSNTYESALHRPEKFANTNWAASREVADSLKGLFEFGMDPVEVGRKVLRGIERNDLYILTHPENKDEFRELCDEVLAAWPDEPIPPERQAIEDQRRAAKRAAREKTIGVGDLAVTKPDAN
jgi:NAD(P)-dependent dehydrogenase (short-subunit alcohol dehydrogenase family)